MFAHCFVLLIPVTLGQLILGPCPRPPPFEQNLDMKQYSGGWYVVAQSPRHPLKASDCQRVTYTEKNGTLVANFSYFDNQVNRLVSKHGLVKKDFRPPVGNMYLKFDDIPRSYQFRVLKANYSDLAVEYTCMSGVFNYTTSLTVLQRRVPPLMVGLKAAIDRFNLKSVIPIHLRKELKLVNHAKC